MFYESQGRRGGQCQQLGVPVQGSWKSCSLALPPFMSTWKELDPLVLLQPSAVELEPVMAFHLQPSAVRSVDPESSIAS